MLFEILVYHTSHQLSQKSVKQAVLTVEHTVKCSIDLDNTKIENTILKRFLNN